MSDNEDLILTDLEVACMLLFCMMIAYIVTKFQFNYLPESGATMIVGMGAGAIARFALNKEISFDSTFFYYFLLPPIIFDAGYSLKRRDFFSNIGSILTFAVFGTLITSVLIGSGIYVLSAHTSLNALNSTDIVDSLVFGSLLSAIDPVAALSVLGNLNVDPLLYSLVFGEAVLNDAVSIALVHSFLQFRENEDPSVQNIFKAIGNFILVSVGSLLIGFGVALVSAFAYKRLDMKHHPYFETSVLLVLAYISFLMAEAATLSGLISLFFCGVTMAHYTFYSLSNVSRIAFGHTSKTLTFISETVVYLYLGLHAFSEANANYDVGFIVAVVCIVIFTRFFAVVPLSFILNRFRKVKISFNMQCMMSFAGLRGAIAYSLAVSLPTCSPNDSSCTLDNNALISTTNVVVLFTTLVLGCLTEPVLRLFKIDRFTPDEPASDGAEHDPVSHVSKPDFDSDVSRSLLNPETKKRTRFHEIWVRLDERFMKPLFGGRSRHRRFDQQSQHQHQHQHQYQHQHQLVDDTTENFDVAPKRRKSIRYNNEDEIDVDDNVNSDVETLLNLSNNDANGNTINEYNNNSNNNNNNNNNSDYDGSYSLYSDFEGKKFPSRQQSVLSHASHHSRSIASAAFNYYLTADDIERQSHLDNDSSDFSIASNSNNEYIRLQRENSMTSEVADNLRSGKRSASNLPRQTSNATEKSRSKSTPLSRHASIRDVSNASETVDAVLDEVRTSSKDYRVRSTRDVVVDSNILSEDDDNSLYDDYQSHDPEETQSRSNTTASSRGNSRANSRANSRGPSRTHSRQASINLIAYTDVNAGGNNNINNNNNRGESDA